MYREFIPIIGYSHFLVEGVKSFISVTLSHGKIPYKVENLELKVLSGDTVMVFSM